MLKLSVIFAFCPAFIADEPLNCVELVYLGESEFVVICPTATIPLLLNPEQSYTTDVVDLLVVNGEG